MIEVTVKLNYEGKNYQTNVIVRKDTPDNQILQIAREQVRKQWTNYH
ncbi:BA3454 family stress response protein [Neobacillus sp. NPDC093182]